MENCKLTKENLIVKESFLISGNGVGILPYESLPNRLFRRNYYVSLEFPDGTHLKSEAVVESLLVSVSKKEEYFTFVLLGFEKKTIPKNTKISIIKELHK